MYQTKKTGNNEINNHARKLETTTKEEINYVLAPNIINDHSEERKHSLTTGMLCKELFSILFEDMNLIGGETCRNNIIYIPGNDKWLALPKGLERGTYMRLYNRLVPAQDVHFSTRALI